ncbi:MAG TPA: carboxypeptidase-like regulatory domain-containing protein, partial [Caldilineaceae bacterium]|nr:carboxypeptidase-like regulatory domain-containing protein [Caldilineaceae bacterium]
MLALTLSTQQRGKSAMELHEYPRPVNDTGIGVHWCPGYATAVGMNRIRDFWLPELKALGVKWVKIFNHDGALDFAELLLAEGIMPLVRIYHPTPNPSRLSVKEVVQIDAFLRSGVRYFEFNSEPDQDSEWRGGRVPANGIDLVVENTIANLETILERGGMPGIPAVSNGSRWDLVGKIIAHGRKDLFSGPVWQALHNFPRNRPPDYPYDIGNQEGAAYTYRFYQVVLNEDWGENSWRGRTLEDINRLRHGRCAPGATIADDPACWLAYEYFDARNRSHLGRSLPLLATEGGYLVGEDIDPRYPATSPDLHMAQTLETCRIMMGVSQRFKPAADYYFCTAFWLLANAQLGSSSPWWENHAWYSERWPGGALPIVTALKAEPKVARTISAQQGELVTILGAVAHAGDHRVVVLERNGVERMRVELDAQSRYQMTGLLPGSYVLRLLDTAVEQPVELTPGRREVVVNLDGAPAQAGLSRSQISGAVRGGSGAVVSLVRAGDGQEWVTMARSDGLYRFVDLPAGAYSVRVNPEGSRVDQVVLDGANQRTVNLAVAGWGYTIRPLDGQNLATLYCSVEGQKNVTVQAHSGDWSSPPVRTGSAPEISPYGCVISPLEAGHYIVAVEGLIDEAGKKIDLEARVHVDKKRPIFVEFVHSRVSAEPEPARSKITGRVIGGLPAGEKLVVRMIDGNAEVRDQQLAEDATFVFADLPAGLYSLNAVDHSEIEGTAAITLDGQNHVSVELMAPIQPNRIPPGSRAQSVLAASAPHAAGQPARLQDALGNEWARVVSHDDYVLFDGLPAGLYSLSIAPGYHQAELRLDGANGLEVVFAELLPAWEAEVANAGSMPGYSVVRVDVEDKVDLPVHIWKEDWEGMMRRTGSKPELGPHALEFSPLGPGHYMIEPEGLG